MASSTKSFLRAAAEKTTASTSGTAAPTMITGYEAIVDSVITTKRQLTDLEAQLKLTESSLLEVAQAEYEQRASSGDYQTNLVYHGQNTNGAMVVFSDRFSALSVDSEESLRKLDPDFDRHFREERKLTLTKTDDATIELLLEKLGQETFLSIFKIAVQFAAKPGLARELSQLSPELRSQLKQAKPGVREVTSEGKAA